MGEPHTNSYYAATLNTETNYPELTESVTCDVAVIGGGFSGVATSLTLAERGYDVVLLEQNRIGWGASGRNGGQLIHGVGGTTRIRNRLGNVVDDSRQAEHVVRDGIVAGAYFTHGAITRAA